jgi:hypothetical protein
VFVASGSYSHWPWCWACGNLCWHLHCTFLFCENPLRMELGLGIVVGGASHPLGGINNSNLMLSLEGVSKLTH